MSVNLTVSIVNLFGESYEKKNFSFSLILAVKFQTQGNIFQARYCTVLNIVIVEQFKIAT